MPELLTLCMLAAWLLDTVGAGFHDSRHDAITRLAKKLDVLTFARMVRHRDIRLLMIYYNKSAADIAREP